MEFNYKGKIKNDNKIELTYKIATGRRSRRGAMMGGGMMGGGMMGGGMMGGGFGWGGGQKITITRVQ